ncbi:DUF4252 domain-containing protein [Fulvivirga lutimaris]|uniref:DUF4252 domain-containing protein n=1 Tax=Fulvivirga lutimaris TaxID=1819566 RepID=UPI0012BBD920|nr:DUF4252 domain-containing protein [Fulvivirga lutimaris]MTI41389.1 DUF4252 domain-containing protein [Fulvivirga lutimaris]
MKRIIVFLIVMSPLLGVAQSKTTQSFHKDHEDAFVLFFYSNTLKMLNQTDDPEFAEMIKQIEKMKFVRVDKKADDFDKDDYNDLVDDYKDEDFEDLMTMRHEGMNVNAYIQEDDGVTTGIVMLMQDDESVSVLDIKGSIPLNKIGSIISKVKALNE